MLTNYPAWNYGHNNKIRTPIIISADSRRAATGSDDGTIIIWDLESGSISQEWFIEDGHRVDYLAFSPDNQYLMSVSAYDANVRKSKTTIWDLHEGGLKVIPLTGMGGHWHGRTW